MSDTDEETAMWPGSPYALIDTGLCPGCFQALTGTTCMHCGLVVADPRALRLLELGRGILDLEAQRQQLINEIRLAHRTATEPQLPPAPGPQPTLEQPWWAGGAELGAVTQSAPSSEWVAYPAPTEGQMLPAPEEVALSGAPAAGPPVAAG